MAKQTTVTEVLIDDLDGSPGERTVYFTWDGIAYEIELSRKNVATFERSLKPFVDAARRVRGPQTRRASGARAKQSSGRDLGAVREWAAANGIAVSARGRVAASVLEAYDAAQR